MEIVTIFEKESLSRPHPIHMALEESTESGRDKDCKNINRDEIYLVAEIERWIELLIRIIMSYVESTKRRDLIEKMLSVSNDFERLQQITKLEVG